MSQKLRIAINAQLSPGDPSGGIVTVVRALAALAQLEGDEEYIFVGPYEEPEWLRPLLGPGQRIVRGPKTTSARWRIDQREQFKRTLGPLRPVAREVKQFLVPQTQTTLTGVSTRSDRPELKASVGRNFFDTLGCDVIHFPFQAFEVCSVPSIYNPHDLQHLHFPKFFTEKEIARREHLYPLACRVAHTVVVASDFVRRDVVECYGIEANKVQVIPWAPPPLPKSSDSTDTVAHELRIKYGLTDKPFALYPAMTWEHKNHLRLLEAISQLRQHRDLDFQVVCTGAKTDFWPTIQRRLDELGLNGVVKFTGMIEVNELNAFYSAAQFVFLPTLFEAASAPIFEAWQHDVPIACAKVTALPEQVKDGALLFDPSSVNEMTIALSRMTTDGRLREDLIRRGARRLRDFSLERTAMAYRAVYRRAAGRKLSQEDEQLLANDWTRREAPQKEVARG